jgi:endonuclease YncB( thermonuclease family)
VRKATLLGATAIAVGACIASPTTPAPTSAVEALVINVPDGDSLVVELDGVERKVRLIGINAPESDECFGDQAAAGLRDLVDGKRVLISTDVEDTDQYGRLLAYVFIDETLVNEAVVRRGWSLARAYEPNTARQEGIDAAGHEARDQQRGMWAPEGCLSPSKGEVIIADIQPNPPGPDEDTLNGESVTLVNAGATPLDLSGWVLRDASSVHRYTFPSGTILPPSAEIVIASGCGIPDESRAFWCAAGPVWDNAGDSALLLDAQGRMVAIYDY